MSREQIDQNLRTFRDNFGPTVLGGVDGATLLDLMHAREPGKPKCLAYWLEFKNDEEFAGNRFGSIAGGSALKFGIYQRSSDGAWVSGAAKAQVILSLEDAIALAREQRNELLAGCDVLTSVNVTDTTDAVYAQLQTDMEKAAPTLYHLSWSHKYWSLLFSDRLDDYHSPVYQRFHLLKLLQMPPDKLGILDGNAPRFNCAGRFISLARELGMPVTTLDKLLNLRDGSMHGYWKVGTVGSTGEGSFWDAMRDGGFVAIAWKVPELTAVLAEEKQTAKKRIADWVLPLLSTPNDPAQKAVASRKAGEILNFARGMEENDIVLACQGQTVLGVGRISGAYKYDEEVAFAHQRPVNWVMLEPWQLPVAEAPRTTTAQLGKFAENILALERRLLDAAPIVIGPPVSNVAVRRAAPLPALDDFSERIDSILARKGQVIIYGPPGTGKTFRALSVANELAARQRFQRVFAELSGAERSELKNPKGAIRFCTFHPGWGYEDFIEGLRPKTTATGMVFEARDGIFKRICRDAADQPDRRFFLVIDEINRGDLPRIFGELLTTIELDKRERPVTLPVTGESFVIPMNVCIIGTMNTADRSISLIDIALRRRFGFVELMPDSGLLGATTVGGLQLGSWLDALNLRLRKHLKRDARNLQVGHAYLMPKKAITSVADFSRVLRDDIIPLLEEYCYDDFTTLRDILGAELVDAEAGRIRDDIFGANRDVELISAVSFEELPSIILSKAESLEVPTDQDADDAEPEDGDPDDDDVSAS